MVCPSIDPGSQPVKPAGSIEGKELYWIAISVILCHMTAHPNRSSELCTACGICCSGAIFNYARIEADEDSDTYARILKIEPDEQGWRFDLPCIALCGTACSTYAVRPRICGDYKCQVLTRLEQGELGFDEAAGFVSEARAAVDRVTACLRPDENLATARTRWRSMDDNWRENPQFHLQMTALNLLLDREFREEDQSLLAKSNGMLSPSSAQDQGCSAPSTDAIGTP